MKEKKLQVFVSSTYVDLKEERQAAVEAILKAGHIPAGMELFTAGDESQWDIIKRWIDESDVYVLILGGRYGSIDLKSGKSYTQMEFEYAVEIGKPLFSMVLSEKFIDTKVQSNGKLVLELENNSKLKLFKEDVQSRLVEFCDDIKDIKLSIVNKLPEFSYRKDLTGWIRGDNLVDTGLLAEQIAKLSAENTLLRSQITNSQNVNSLYNGLTYDELESLLLQEEVTEVDERIKNLFDFFMILGPRAKPTRVDFINFRTTNNNKNFNKALRRLAELSMIEFSINPEYISTTPDSHKFYVKVTSKEMSKKLTGN